MFNFSNWTGSWHGLVVVIGKPVDRNISVSSTSSYVLGYTMAHDEMDWQLKTRINAYLDTREVTGYLLFSLFVVSF